MVKEKYLLSDTYILSWLEPINSTPLECKVKIKETSLIRTQHIGTDSMIRDAFLPEMSEKSL